MTATRSPPRSATSLTRAAAAARTVVAKAQLELALAQQQEQEAQEDSDQDLSGLAFIDAEEGERLTLDANGQRVTVIPPASMRSQRRPMPMQMHAAQRFQAALPMPLGNAAAEQQALQLQDQAEGLRRQEAALRQAAFAQQLAIDAAQQEWAQAQKALAQQQATWRCR